MNTIASAMIGMDKVTTRPWEKGIILLFSFSYIVLISILNLTQLSFKGLSILAPLITLTIALTTIILYFSRQGGWFHPLVFIAIWWGWIRGILPKTDIYINGLAFHRISSLAFNENLNLIVTESLVLTTVGYIALALGYIAIKPKRFFRIEARRPKKLNVKLIIVLGISAVALGVMAISAGGVGKLLLQRGLASTDRVIEELGGHYQLLIGLATIATTVYFTITEKPKPTLFFLTCFCTALGLNFLATGSRGGVIVPILIALSIWIIKNQRIPYRAVIIAATLGISTLGILGEMRQSTRGLEQASQISVNTSLTEGFAQGISAISSRSSESDGLLAILARVPHDVDYLYGQSYLSVPAIPIPRSLWPNKPEAGGKLVATQIFENPLTAIPPGPIGEAYWNFSYIGVFAIMFCFGIFLKYLYTSVLHNTSAPITLAIYVYTIFILQPSSPQIYAWVHTLASVILIYIFFVGFPKIRKRAIISTKPIR